MSKFLDLIEENTPDLDLDEKIAAKRAVQRCLMEKDIRCDADQRSEDISIHLPDGRIVKLEVKKFVNVEDGEIAMDDLANAELALDAAAKIKAAGGDRPSRGVKKIEKSENNLQKKVATTIDKIAKELN